MKNDFSNGNWPAFNTLLHYFIFFLSKDYLYRETCSKKDSLIYSRSKSSQRGRQLEAQATGTRIRAGRPQTKITAMSMHTKHQKRGVSWLLGLPAPGLVRTRVGGRTREGDGAETRLRSACFSRHHPNLLRGRWPRTVWHTGTSPVCPRHDWHNTMGIWWGTRIHPPARSLL